MPESRGFAAAAKDHGLKNPRFFRITASTPTKLTLTQLRKNELPEDLVYVDGWLEGVTLIGRVAEVVGREGEWVYVFGEGVSKKDIAACFPKLELTLLP